MCKTSQNNSAFYVLSCLWFSGVWLIRRNYWI